MVKVLVADDDSDQLFLISRVLQRAGFQTIPVEHGADVVSIARAERPDVILLDVQMEDQAVSYTHLTLPTILRV